MSRIPCKAKFGVLEESRTTGTCARSEQLEMRSAMWRSKYGEVEEEVKKVEDGIRGMEETITDVEHKIESIERQVCESSDREKRDRLGKSLEYLWQDELALRQDEHDLRRKEEALRSTGPRASAMITRADPMRKMAADISEVRHFPRIDELDSFLKTNPLRSGFPISSEFFRLLAPFDTGKLFRMEDSQYLCKKLDCALSKVLEPPQTGSTEDAFHQFWDDIVNDFLQLFCTEPIFRDRNTSRDRSSGNFRPDVIGQVGMEWTLWREEERAEGTAGVPKQELLDKLTWVYVLRQNSRYLSGRGGKQVRLYGKSVRKLYQSRAVFDRVLEVYDLIRGCPNSEQVVSSSLKDGAGIWHSIVFQPRCGLRSARQESELVKALVCIAEALVWLHKRSIMHRDIRWPNIGPQNFGEAWILLDFDEACISPQSEAHRSLCPESHAPETCTGGHGCSVDIWGMGHLIKTSKILGLAPQLIKLQDRCLDLNPRLRPSASYCYSELSILIRDGLV